MGDGRAGDHRVERCASLGQRPSGPVRDAGDRQRAALPGPDRAPGQRAAQFGQLSSSHRAGLWVGQGPPSNEKGILETRTYMDHSGACRVSRLVSETALVTCCFFRCLTACRTSEPQLRVAARRSVLIGADRRACDLGCRAPSESAARRSPTCAVARWFGDERSVGSQVRARVDAVGEGLDACCRSGTRVDKPPGV